MMRLAIFLLASVMALGSAAAGKHAGVSMPDKVTVDGKPLSLNGMGVREATFLKVDVYVAGLYVQNVTSNPSTLINADEPKMLVLKFVRDVEKKDIVEAWSQGFRTNATVPVERLKPFIDQLNAWMPEFKHGDTLAFIYTPGQGVAVEVNNVRKGVIKDSDFARSLFSIWLGPNPPTADLKRGLLGKHPKA